MADKLSKAAKAALDEVTDKRPKAVVDHIRKHGSVTTEELRTLYGYDHAPRAARDLRENGIPLVTTMVKDSSGKRMARYTFGDLENITAGRVGGRSAFPKAFKEDLSTEYGTKCSLCSALFELRYLQIDHRIPYLVAGEGVAAKLDTKDYMLVCGSCNRAKSWSCERCPNGLGGKDSKVCTACYWANPLQYAHVATQDIRRLDLTWIGVEVPDYDAAKAQAASKDQAMPEFVKDAVRRALRSNGPDSTDE
ncbi:MAG: HNH endonuclease [Acidobacteria bacterium]|nr:HNH endonuclease [Acidobacteriota bacterium]